MNMPADASGNPFQGFESVFASGQKQLDQQHAELAQAMDQLRESLMQGLPGGQAKVEMAAVVLLAKNHFQTEESLFAHYHYPKAEEHGAEHRQFLAEVATVIHAMEHESDGKRLAALVNLFMLDWLRNHVARHDRDFHRFVAEKHRREGVPFKKWLYQLVQTHVEDVLGESLNHFSSLFFPWRHSDLIRARRCALIVSRVRMLAGLFALLTPTWIVVDYMFLPVDLAGALALARMLATLGFAALSLAFRRSDQLSVAYLGVGLLFFIPTLFFIFTNFLFTGVTLQLSPLAANLLTGYAFLPFIMAAGISIFPLTALEGGVMVMPVLLAELFTGTFNVSFHGDPGNYGTLWLLMLIAGVATLAGMSQLHFWIEILSKSSHDALTKVYNRAAGQELMEKYTHMALRHHTALCLFFFDLDNFKSINDVYGHEAGDTTLQTLAQSLMKVTRKEDVIVRWGGEEFLVMIPLARQEDSQSVLRRLCSKGSLGKRPDGHAITASVGLAEVVADGVERLSQLITLADERMYRAKKSGKNRVCYGDGEHALTEIGIF